MLHRSKLYAAGLLVAVFAAGVAVGTGVSAAASDGRTDQPDRESRPRESYADRLARELELTPPQRDSVALVVTGYQDSMAAMWDMMRPRMDSIRSSIRHSIMEMLDSTQQARYEAYIRRSDSARAARGEGGHRGSSR